MASKRSRHDPHSKILSLLARFFESAETRINMKIAQLVRRQKEREQAARGQLNLFNNQITGEQVA